ncbi:Alpha/beta hydrolase domain-containing protein 4 [Phytophthora boehmeriae]|uniref:Alpha/beta hydrolase domain-containing protein 4 n=1 Tax=Phytophthora boehmeriae TaxID=109152 RepID=A0A8T1X0T9_9STRA|nr:Alpha/beta hydrolase domain-containing protein 4 [Phytophthora boehmeriae]
MTHMKLVLAVFLAPLGIPIAVLWGLLGLLFTMAVRWMTLLALVTLWTPWTCDLWGSRALPIQVPAAATVSLALSLVMPKRLMLHLSLWLAMAQYIITCVFDRYSAYWFVALACFVQAWSAICQLRLWLPADATVLHSVEYLIYKSFLGSEFTMSIVAGLGTVHVPCSGEKENARTLVLVHGYGAGNAFWAPNLKGLAESFDVYVVEWKGIGRSIRPVFKPKDTQEADAFFVESLEEWRKELELDHFILCGHSMGALYGTYYAAKYPGSIDHMILVSPAGVQASSVVHADLPLTRRIAFALHLTPMSAARAMGPFGPRLVHWMVKKRVSWTPPSNAIQTGELNIVPFAKYCYHNWALKASGDIAVHTHLHPGAAARGTPLSDIVVPEKWTLPVTFVYGGGPDWMPKEHGEAVVERLQKAGKSYVSFRIVPLSGHQVFMDNPSGFNSVITEAVLDWEKDVGNRP